ncbi:unnamed protein product [Rotaria socialis]
MDPGGFWQLLVDSGGFYGSWWNLRLLMDSRIHQEPLFPPCESKTFNSIRWPKNRYKSSKRLYRCLS